MSIEHSDSPPTPRFRPTASLRRRLLTMIGMGAITAVILFTVAVYFLLSNMEQQMWANRQNDAANNAVTAIDGYMDNVDHSLNLLVALDLLDTTDARQTLLDNWLRTNPQFLEVILISSEGDTIAAAAQHSPVLANRYTIPQSQWFLDAVDGQATLGSVQISADDAPYLVLARPSTNGNVIAARLALNFFWDVVDNSAFGDSGVAYIIEESGAIVAHPDQQLVLDNGSIAGRPEWNNILTSEQFAWAGRYNNVQDETVLGRTRQIPDTTWIIITEVEQLEATNISRIGLMTLSGGALLLCSLILWSIAQLLEKSIFKPLDVLRGRARRIAEGKFGEVIRVRRADEMGELAVAFNDMSDALRIRDSRIAAQNKALAEEVKDRKRAQENLQRLNAELVHSSRYKDEFLATMSHELRTPLNAILGMSEALVVPVYGEMNPQQKKAVNHIRESGQHLLSLIDDILDLSKIAAGRSPLEYSPVTMDTVAQASLRMVAPMVRARKITLTSYIDEHVNAIMADERRLKQILVNLLNNAVKFTDESGTVGLSIEGDPVQEVVRFTVSDTGIGIPKDSIGQLFEPFVQLDGSLSRQYGGTGLGLTLVNRLVDMHGGSIEVESEEGVGSRFIVSIPWREPDDDVEDAGHDIDSATSAAAQSAAQGATILLAEDREANILTLLDYLNLKGFNVIVARNGQQAIDMAKGERPDLILMDIQMPEVNGLDAIRAIREDTSVNHTPIIALTALAMPGDRERCLEAGADDYVSKPVSLRQLVQVIETQLSTPRAQKSVPATLAKTA